jgi:hypothetical protein
MAIKYLSGERIQATSTDFAGTPAISGGWKEVGRTTLGSAGDTIDVSSIPDKRYYMVLTSDISSGIIDSRFRLGNSTVDTGSNYARRSSENGGSEVTGVNNDSLLIPYGENVLGNLFGVHYFANKSDKEKLLVGNTVDEYATGAGNAPARFENTGKWSNTSDVIDVIRNYNAQSGSFDTGSEMVVLGWDETDTHTTNFWEELATNTASGGGSTQEVTFTAKKYLWFQCYFELSGSTDIPRFQVGNGSFDTGNNYAERFSGNGGTDETQTSRGDLHIDKASSKPFFVNGFIINNASNEKLFIMHSIEQNTAGAGNAPTRIEHVGKWTNTSNQIDRLRTTFGTDTINAGAVMKVWGSD